MSRVRNVILLLLVLVCGASFWLARRSGSVPALRTDAHQSTPVVQDSVAPIPATAHVSVLNGTGVAGLARRVSRLLPPLGCVVMTVADAPHDTFSHSLLINRRLDREQARRLGGQLAVSRVLEEWDSRCDEDVVLVLGADHQRILTRLGASP